MISQTKPRKEFKALFGQANHFIITALVGLDGLERNEVQSAPEELHTAWSPKDPKQSVRRSRTFILRNALSSAVDALDVYLTLLWREPKWINGSGIEAIYSQAGRSIHAKAIELSRFLNVPDVERAMIEVIITWRNNVMHELARNVLSGETVEILKRETNIIQKNYCGLDTSNLARKSNTGSDFTFKEAASLIHATHKFVEEFDRIVISRLNIPEFLENYFQKKLDSNKNFKRDFFCYTDKRRRNLVLNVIENELGFPKGNESVTSMLKTITAYENIIKANKSAS